MLFCKLPRAAKHGPLRLIVSKSRLGIADVRDPKGRGLHKTKKSPLCGSKHHKSELCSPCDRFSPTVRIELGENGGNMKLGGVKRNSQSTCDRFVGGAVCHRCKDFDLARGVTLCADCVIATIE